MPVQQRSNNSVEKLNNKSVAPEFISIRQYEIKDKSRCNWMFVTGIDEFYIAFARNFLKSPISITVISIFLASMYLFADYLNYLLVGLLFWPIVAFGIMRYMLNAYYKDCFNSDLKDIYQYYTNSPGSNFWVAEINEKVPQDLRSHFTVGEVIGMVAIDYKSEDHTGELRRMSVHPKARRYKIASALINQLLDYARQNKYKKVWFTTSEFQVPAIKLYERHGFEYVPAKDTWDWRGNWTIMYFHQDIL
jgi:ribosomal protein S18 acetylase RimI-like enzyme